MPYRILDLFCKAGGGSMGYHKAGLEVVGVDIEFQKRYPFRLIVADALKVLQMKDFVAGFDAIHASPPCQLHSSLAHLPSFKPEKHQDLIEPVRGLLRASGKPFVIENVPGAPLIEPFTLCGTMFGLRTDCGAELRRHRLFETNWFDDLLCMPQCQHYADRSIGITGTGNAMTGKRTVISVYGDHARDTAAEKRKYCKKTVTGDGHTSNDWGQIRDRRRTITFTGGNADNVKGANRTPRKDGTQREKIRETFPIEQARKAMGIEWMTGAELSQAIPPAYTQWIGQRLQEYLQENESPC